MKKILIAMFTIASLSTMAQDPDPHGPRHAKDPLTPEQAATLKTKRMTLALDLTQIQQEQVQKLHLENARLRIEKMGALKKEGDAAWGKDLSADERFARESERLDHMIAQKASMKKILNEEQFERWEKTLHHRKHRGHPHERDARGRR